MEPVGSLSPLASRVYLLGFGLRLFVSRRGNDLCLGAAGRAKLDRNHSRITDDFAAEFFQIGGGFGHIVHFNGEVMDVRSQSGSAGFRRLLAVILDQSKIDSPVSEMARGMISDLTRFHFHKAKALFVKLRRLLEIIDFERAVNDARHKCSFDAAGVV